MNKTRFKQLVVGEKFKLPYSDILMSKETLRQEPGIGYINAIYDITNQGQPCYLNDDTQVVRRRSNQGTWLETNPVRKNLNGMMINGHNLGRW